MKGQQLYWGDTHTHLTDLDQASGIIENAKENIDFSVILLYPFSYEIKNGFRIETTQNRPEYFEHWKKINEISQRNNVPGSFTTFPGYEWNGNRTKYGDHNVIYLNEGNPLDDCWELSNLYTRLAARKAIAIPHHTGYLVGSRGKDWNFFDPNLSPVMELYSQHGSSEGVETPGFMANNTSMGPGTDGGTYRNALTKGLRIGVIGSNDGPGLPGRWGMGRAAVWAVENTRVAIWESFSNHSTYAVTGDRIRLDFYIGETDMGGELSEREAIDINVDVVCSQGLDKIELVRNGRIISKYAHVARISDTSSFPNKFKLFLEVGWGPAKHNGFSLPEGGWTWDGSLHVEGGKITSIERCFSLPGQSVVFDDPQDCHWSLKTAARDTRSPMGLSQGLILELMTNENATIELSCEGKHVHLPVRTLLTGTKLIPLIDEIIEVVNRQFGLSDKDVLNPDAYYQNARKMVLHRASPVWEYEVSHVFPSVPLEAGENSFYVIVSQTNGQRAWSSPIWVNNSR